MRNNTTLLCVVLFAIAGWSQTSMLSGEQGSAWTKKAATACKQLLTQDFVGGILVHPAGKSDSAEDSCSYSTNDDATLKIDLAHHITQELWDSSNKQYRPHAKPVAGVGDKAVSDENPPVVHSWKSDGRTCGVMLLSFEQPKLTGDALAKKLGEICNQLFAIR